MPVYSQIQRSTGLEIAEGMGFVSSLERGILILMQGDKSFRVNSALPEGEASLQELLELWQPPVKESVRINARPESSAQRTDSLQAALQSIDYSLGDLIFEDEAGKLYRGVEESTQRSVNIRWTPGASSESAIAPQSNPGWVEVLTQGKVPEGGLFTVLKSFQGELLAKTLPASPRAPKACCEMILALCDALQESHARGVAHGALGAGVLVVSSEGLLLIGGGEAPSSCPADDLKDLGKLLFTLLVGRESSQNSGKLESVCGLLGDEDFVPELEVIIARCAGLSEGQYTSLDGLVEDIKAVQRMIESAQEEIFSIDLAPALSIPSSASRAFSSTVSLDEPVTLPPQSESLLDEEIEWARPKRTVPLIAAAVVVVLGLTGLGLYFGLRSATAPPAQASYVEVTLSSRPSGASVSLEGKALGKTPLVRRMLRRPGSTVNFLFELPDHQAYSVESRLDRSELSIKAELKRSDGESNAEILDLMGVEKAARSKPTNQP